MRRSRWARLRAAAMAAWFAIATIAPAWPHDCAAHGTLGHAAGAPHRAPHSAPRDAPPPTRHDHGCVGPCCCAALVATPAVPVIETAIRAAPRAATRPPVDRRYRPSVPEHARPPSLGPPPLLVG